MSIVGQTYLEHGEPVEILVQWRSFPGAKRGVLDHNDGRPTVLPHSPTDLVIDQRSLRARSGPRNVLIRRANGDLVVRPFRGLRRPKVDTGADE